MFGVVVSSYFCISLRPVVIRLSQVFVSELFFEAELRIFFHELLLWLYSDAKSVYQLQLNFVPFKPIFDHIKNIFCFI